MVRSKKVPKKPKDPLLTPPSKLRGGFLDEGRTRNRGGAAMSPTPASVPNYMRATSSSDAKGGHRARLGPATASASPKRRRPAVRVVTKGKVLFPEVPGCSGSGPGRATCSSTMKEAKFPDTLDLAPGATDVEGPAAMRVCPYTYCSLNGHAHAPAVPLLSFLASRRRLIKTQQRMKLKGASAFRKKSGDKNGGAGAKVAPLIDEEAVGDFFVEVYAGPRVSSDMSCSDMSLDEMDATVRRMEFVMFDRCGADEENEKGKDLAVCRDAERLPRLEERRDACRDSSSECSGADIAGDFVELPWMRYHGYEYDILDDEILEEQRVRNEEAGEAEISEEQEDEEGTSGRSADECDEDAGEEQEANDEEKSSNPPGETEIVTEQESVVCRVEACEELDGRDEDNILDTVCHGEPSAGQGTAEEKLSEDVYKSAIPDQEVAGKADTILEESCKEETSADREAKDDECSVESDGESEVTEEQDVKDEESTPDDGSEMEISEDTISSDGCREYFSEEVTSRAVLADDVFEQYDSIADDNTANDVFEQHGCPANAQNDAKKELGITTSNLEVDSEETAIDQQTNQDGTVDGTKDDRKELEITTYKLEEASEESDTAQASNPDGIPTCVNYGAQMEPEITICKLKDASEESGVTQESSINDNAEYVTDGAGMGLEITRCKLEYASEETGIDQETVEDDDSACVSDDAQNDLEITECKSEDTFKEPVTIQEVDESDIAANVSSAAQNESELTKCIIGQEADHDDCSAYVTEGSQNESEVTTRESEGAQEESDAVKEEEDEVNTAGSLKRSEITACESGGASEKSAMPQEADGHDNTIDASDSAQKDITMPKLDACDDIHVTEETNQLFNVQIPEHKYDCTAEGHAEPQNISAEFTDAKEPSIDDICGAFSGMNLKGDVYFDPAESTTCPRNKLIISRRRRTPEEEEYIRGFNPRPPNFLPLELDPDAEKVDLKHQMMDERKNAEEWMIDYALRRAVTNLAPAQKKKVELLVQAFETVLPHDEDGKKSITPTRPVLACN
ncbi:uncharacterized protein LOC133928794 isoform X2 [Phragmites australis]|uniref:uncharacterized protein LOC133928794 isoform X2 n=1 Tax=Phragmites australis TaxID=29695 RepID=UPI002D764F4D|nr:uncharacterized protein LOC133928794 isoform X2 [Phragmites australis]